MKLILLFLPACGQMLTQEEKTSVPTSAAPIAIGKTLPTFNLTDAKQTRF